MLNSSGQDVCVLCVCVCGGGGERLSSDIADDDRSLQRCAFVVDTSWLMMKMNTQEIHVT